MFELGLSVVLWDQVDKVHASKLWVTGLLYLTGGYGITIVQESRCRIPNATYKKRLGCRGVGSRSGSESVFLRGEGPYDQSTELCICVRPCDRSWPSQQACHRRQKSWRLRLTVGSSVELCFQHGVHSTWPAVQKDLPPI